MSEHVLKKEDEILKKRLKELDLNSYNRGNSTFSDFLNLYEQSIFHQTKFLSSNTLCGGYENAERVIACFYNNELSYLPIICLKIINSSAKFSQNLTHRDYLGSILGLGIDRGKIGDIIVGDDCTYCFVVDKIADYIVNNLTKVKNAFVTVQICDDYKEHIQPKFKEITGSISSLRLDCILSLAFNISRSQVTSKISDGLVYVNGRIITTNSYNIKDGDIISVRHLGRFKFDSIMGNTKKDRYFVKLYKYI